MKRRGRKARHGQRQGQRGRSVGRARGAGEGEGKRGTSQSLAIVETLLFDVFYIICVRVAPSNHALPERRVQKTVPALVGQPRTACTVTCTVRPPNEDVDMPAPPTLAPRTPRRAKGKVPGVNVRCSEGMRLERNNACFGIGRSGRRGGAQPTHTRTAWRCLAGKNWRWDGAPNHSYEHLP